MKKLIIGSLVGAILLFGWQAVAHMFMHHHDASYQQVSNENEVMTALNAGIKKEGQYMVPGMDMNGTDEQLQQYDTKMKGRPWAMITYHPVYENDMAMSSFRSFVTAFLCVMIFIGIIGKNPGSFMTIFFKAVGLGLLAFLFVWYNQNIWMQTPWEVIKGELIDLLVAWGLCGLWLGWYLNTGPTEIEKRYSTV